MKFRAGWVQSTRLVKQSLFQKSSKNTHIIAFTLNHVSKFPWQPSFHTPGSLSFPRIPTLASLAVY